ncbi:hypothetical protein C0993_003874 [Termitomyces sp. T159_Od127]|nr:hypothetical protein C0993_003874 [Termitomyces sp. T159_Od127]
MPFYVAIIAGLTISEEYPEYQVFEHNCYFFCEVFRCLVEQYNKENMKVSEVGNGKDGSKNRGQFGMVSINKTKDMARLADGLYGRFSTRLGEFEESIRSKEITADMLKKVTRMEEWQRELDKHCKRTGFELGGWAEVEAQEAAKKGGAE